ncbi:MAG TPA: hypothetical protein PLA01_08580 [Acetivibrio sp.]|nr:hypothetical protein [Acetivibrio sp.]
MYFSSKKGLGIGLLIWIFMIAGLIATFSAALFTVYRTKLWFIMVIYIVPLFFAGWIWFGTGYFISPKEKEKFIDELNNEIKKCNGSGVSLL